MPVRSSKAEWKGALKGGQGTFELGSGAYKGAYSFGSRFEDAPASNPEELIAAAHASCFAMALSHGLDQDGHTPRSVKATAKVHLEKAGDGFAIPRIDLECEADVPGISEADFRKAADAAKSGCPVSKVLAGAQISLNARLVKS